VLAAAVLLALCAVAVTAEDPVIPVLRITIHVDVNDRELFRETESIYVPLSVWEARHGPLTEVDKNQLKKQMYLREYIRWCFAPI
jgi:hypothetical protein